MIDNLEQFSNRIVLILALAIIARYVIRDETNEIRTGERGKEGEEEEEKENEKGKEKEFSISRTFALNG